MPGHCTSLTERLDAKACHPDQGHRHRLADARHRAAETLRVARLRGVHAGDDAKLRRRERSDAEMEVHLATGDEVILQFAHIATHRDPRSHRHEQIKPHDAAIEQPVKMSAGGLGEHRDHKKRRILPRTPKSHKRAVEVKWLQRSIFAIRREIPSLQEDENALFCVSFLKNGHIFVTPAEEETHAPAHSRARWGLA